MAAGGPVIPAEPPLGMIVAWNNYPVPRGWSWCDGSPATRHLQRVLIGTHLPRLPGMIIHVNDKVHPRWHPEDL